MKICAYMAICLSLPFALLADEAETGETETAPEEGAAVSPAAQAEGFQRYKTILDRMPFGIPPPGFDPDSPGGSADTPHGAAAGAEGTAAETAASEVEQQILSSVTVSMLNRSPDGRIFVGFTDKSVQPPRNYMLRVGEKREGCEWLVVDADPDNGEVKLSKDGVEATLKMGGGGNSSPGEKGKQGGATPKAALAHTPPGPGLGPGPRPGLGFRNRQPSPLAGPGGPVGEGGEKTRLTGLEIARARRQERMMAEAEKQRQATEQMQKEREERERERKEREQEKRARELAAEERKMQMDQLLQLQEELRRQREAREANQQPGDVQEANPE